MQLARFPRRRYAAGPTPLEPLDRLSKHLGGPRVWIKRDDLQGLAQGGNKLRKLEFLVADALERGADTLVTGGAIQSNHCRLTLAAANREGLRCQLVLEERVAGGFRPDAGGNALLYRVLGAEEIHVVPPGTDVEAAIAERVDVLTARGRTPYGIPIGGSTPLGALGYVDCAREILRQGEELGVAFDHLVCASGSGGTQAGLVAGLAAASSDLRVVGVCVSRSSAEQDPRVRSLADRVFSLLGIAGCAPEDAIETDDGYVGPGYSYPTPEMREAVRAVASLEGVLLDPVYTGKAMAGLFAMARGGRFGPGEDVLFLHTGGTPGLYAYADQVE